MKAGSVNNQDFEAYAHFKPFNDRVSNDWAQCLEGALAMIGKPRQDIGLLDYGCGDGKYFRHFCEIGLDPDHIHGLEVSTTRLARCHAIGWSKAALLGDEPTLPFPDASLDVINCMEVIEHIPAVQGQRVIAEFARMLRPGGVLLISTPNYPIKRFYDIWDAVMHGRWRRLRDDPTHVTRFGHVRLRALLERHFSSLELKPFKSGFLHRRWPHPTLLHKLFFLCHR